MFIGNRMDNWLFIGGELMVTTAAADSSASIKTLSIVTEAGAKSYFVGQQLAGGVVAGIKHDFQHYTGDPYSTYIGRSDTGKMLFSVSPLCPIECEYL